MEKKPIANYEEALKEMAEIEKMILENKVLISETAATLKRANELYLFCTNELRKIQEEIVIINPTN